MREDVQSDDVIPDYKVTGVQTCAFLFQAEDGIRDYKVTGVQTCALPISVGKTCPEYDRALEGVLDSPRILLPANRLVEIDRMLHLAADLKQPVIIYGGRETFRPEAAALLKKFNAPILLS